MLFSGTSFSDVAIAGLAASFVSSTILLNAYADARNRGFLRRGAIIHAAGASGPGGGLASSQ